MPSPMPFHSFVYQHSLSCIVILAMNASNGYGGMGGGGMGGGGVAGGMMGGAMNGMNSGGNGLMTMGGNGMMPNNFGGGPPMTPGIGLGVAGRPMSMGREEDDGEEAVVYQIVYGKPGPMGIDIIPHTLEYSLKSGQRGIYTPWSLFTPLFSLTRPTRSILIYPDTYIETTSFDFSSTSIYPLK